MRKPIALLFAAALVLGMAGMANAQQTYTWTLVEGSSVALLWPNEANSPNVFEADGGLLGRVLAETNAGVANTCELAPSYPCAALNPPVFLLAAGSSEGPTNVGGGSECNRKVTSCNTAPVPGAAHGGHAAGQDTIGEYSYLVIHTAAQGTNPSGKGIGFFAGTFVQQNDPYACNECPALGAGRDENVAGSLSNTISQSTVTTLSSSLWLTQSTSPFGHAQVSLAAPPGGAGTGSASVCGTGLTYQDLDTDLCVDALSPGTANFEIPDQKTVSHAYSVTVADHANFTNQGRCNGPDCYIQNVIIPAALAQDAGARNVQVLAASSILPSTAPGALANASVDSLLFMYTTQLLDMDGDTTEDRLDPCPNDAANGCTFDIINAVSCAAGEAFCADADGDLSCIDAFLCNSKGDLNNDCLSDSTDNNLLQGVNNGIGGAEVFNTGLSIGPFDP